MPAARDRRSLVAPGPAAWAVGLGAGLGVFAAWQAPEHHGVVVWAASLAAVAVGGCVVAERRRGPRAAAAFGGALLALSPVVALVAHVFLWWLLGAFGLRWGWFEGWDRR